MLGSPDAKIHRSPVPTLILVKTLLNRLQLGSDFVSSFLDLFVQIFKLFFYFSFWVWCRKNDAVVFLYFFNVLSYFSCTVPDLLNLGQIQTASLLWQIQICYHFPSPKKGRINE